MLCSAHAFGMIDYTRTDNAPAPLGPYEQAVTYNGTVYVAMQLPVNPDSEQGALLSLEEETELVITNIKAILEAAGSGLHKTMRVMIYLKDVSHGKRVNAVYERYFTDHKPARGVIEVAALPLGYNVAMDAIGVIEQ